MSSEQSWRWLGRELARARSQAGLTQHQLAPLLHYGRSTVANVEVGRQRVPRRFWQRCDEVLGTGRRLTEAFENLQRGRWQPAPNVDQQAGGYRAVSECQPAPPAGAPLRPSDAVGEIDMEDGMRRRALVRSVAAVALASGLTGMSDARRRISLADVQDRAARTARLRRLDNYLGGRDTLELYEADLRETIAFWKQSVFTEAIGQALLALLAEQAQLVGWAAFDAGDDRYAADWFTTSVDIARHAGNGMLVANALALLAYQKASQGDADVATAEASCAHVDASTPAAVRALLQERLAFTYAVAGCPAQAGRALDAAGDALHHDGAEPAPDWAAWVDHDELQIMIGRVWAQLRRPLRAAAPLETALARFDDTHARDKALYSTWLADAYIDGGEIERAATVLHTSTRLCAAVSSPRPAHRIAAVRRRLHPYRNVPHVADAIGG